MSLPFGLYFSTSKPQPLKSPASGEAKAANLEKYVRTLCAYFPRDYRQLENLNAAADYIHRTWNEFGLPVTEETYSLTDKHLEIFPFTLESRLGPLKELFSSYFEKPEPGSVYRNICVRFPSKPQANNPALVIGAHYDAVHKTPGADDNASGVAGILELGRMLADTPPAIPVILIAWANEEQPFFSINLRGSDFHAQQLRERHEKISGAISLEMIGRYYDEIDTQVYPSKFIAWMRRKYTQGNFIAFVSSAESCNFVKKVTDNFRAASTFPVHAASLPRRLGGPRILGSDHLSYMRQGFPALMMTDTAENRIHPNIGSTYHTEKDTPETLNYQKMAEFLDGVFQMLQKWR